MNYIQYMKEGGNFGNKLKTRIKNLLYQRDHSVILEGYLFQNQQEPMLIKE